MSIRILGVTGPTGAGKSLFSDYLAEKGIPVIDADEVYHKLLIPPSPCLDALREAFGDAILLPDGTLDRPALSRIVFHDEAKLALLNETVLGMVLDKIRGIIRVLERSGAKAVAVDAPTLIESGFHLECDTVVSVLASPETRLGRIMERDGLTKEAAESRVRAQKPDDFYRTHSHFTLINDGSREELFARGDALFPLLKLPV